MIIETESLSASTVDERANDWRLLLLSDYRGSNGHS